MARQRSQQIDFFNSKSQFGKRAVHGGSERPSDRKYKRPLSTKDHTHLILRSSKSKGTQSFRSAKNLKKIEEILQKQARLAHVQLDRFSINSNHLHLLILFKRREFYFRFVRAISGLIARQILGVERGTARQYLSPEQRENKKLMTGFWDARPFTRIVKWGKAYFTLARYILRNELEAIGFIKYQRGPKMDFFLREGYFSSG